MERSISSIPNNYYLKRTELLARLISENSNEEKTNPNQTNSQAAAALIIPNNLATTWSVSSA